jgi:hypothetical protein
MLIPREVLEVHRITSKDETRPSLQRVHAERSAEQPRLTATDGRCLLTVTWNEPEVKAGEEPVDFGDLATIPGFVADIPADQCLEIARAVPRGHVSGDSITAAIERCELIEAKANGGTTFGMRTAQSPAAELRRLAAAPPGKVPMWGQRGVFPLDVDGTPYLITYDGDGNICVHAVNPLVPCISETGYRAFCFELDREPINGATVDAYILREIREERDTPSDNASGKRKACTAKKPLPLPEHVYLMDDLVDALLEKPARANGRAKKPANEQRPLQPGDVARCVKCGCTDSQACEGGCSWVYVKKRRQEGLCSACATPEEVAKYSKFRASTAPIAEASV